MNEAQLVGAYKTNLKGWLVDRDKIQENKAGLAQEWCVLQREYDSYEKYSLLIKLVNVTLVTVAFGLGSANWFLAVLVLIVWMQDSIWKTFQSRIETRLLVLERALAEHSNAVSYQFNREFLNRRSGFVGLIKEYLVHAIRPTVAFPHVLLVALLPFV